MLRPLLAWFICGLGAHLSTAAAETNEDGGIVIISSAEPTDKSPIIPSETEAKPTAVVKAFLDTCFAEFPNMKALSTAFSSAGFEVSETFKNDYETDFGDTQYSLVNRRRHISGNFGPSVGSHGGEFLDCEIEAYVANPASVTRETFTASLSDQLDAALQPPTGATGEVYVFVANVRRDSWAMRIEMEVPQLTSIRHISDSAIAECAGQAACRKWSPLRMSIALN
jgi:hypothetical protein